MRRMVRWRSVLWSLFVVFPVAFTPRMPQAEEQIPPAASQRLVGVLGGRRAATEEDWVREAGTRAPSSLRDLFRQTVRAVPIVLSTDGFGSGAVIAVNPAESGAWVVTNHHVVEKPFRNNRGGPVVALVFYDPQLATEPFDPERLASCTSPAETGAWCQALRRSIRNAVVTATDPGRDLALLRVTNLPAGVTRIEDTRIDSVETGDVVATIGHPSGFLWSLTTGPVSGVRSRYPMGTALGTVIQTQTPVSPGSSGGPLLTLEGRLAGVISWSLSEAQGLNVAIAINEVQAFASRFRAR